MMMKKSLTGAALMAAALAGPVPAQQPESQPQGLTLEHRMLLRCSAAFALVAHGQETGEARALGYPSVAERGREYFVRAMATVMEDTGLGREAVTDELTHEAQRLNQGDRLSEIMPSCLLALGNNPADDSAMQ